MTVLLEVRGGQPRVQAIVLCTFLDVSFWRRTAHPFPLLGGTRTSRISFGRLWTGQGLLPPARSGGHPSTLLPPQSYHLRAYVLLIGKPFPHSPFLCVCVFALIYLRFLCRGRGDDRGEGAPGAEGVSGRYPARRPSGGRGQDPGPGTYVNEKMI